MPSNIGATEHHQFYGHGNGAAACAIDLSGNANMTTAAEYMHTAAFGYGAPCTVMGSIRLVATAGYAFSRYSGTVLQGVRHNGGTGLQLVVSNAVVHTMTVPAEGEVTWSWSMTDDPLGPGVRSEFRVWNTHSGGTTFLDGISWTHTEPAGLAASDIIWGARVTTGTNSTGGSLQGAGFLLHGAGSVQVHRDRVIAAAAPTLTGDTAMESTMPDVGSGFGDQDTPAGPTHYLAADAVVANHLLLASPLVNVQWADPEAVPWTTMQADEWWALSPDGTSYMGLPLLWRRPVPQTVNYVRCRMFIETSAASAASFDVTIWSCNRNPGADSAIQLTRQSVTETVSSPAADSPGVWVEFDDLRIERTANGERTWIAVSLEGSGAGVDSLTAAVRAVTIDPLSIINTDAIGEVGNG